MDFEQFPLKKKSLQKDNYDLEKKIPRTNMGVGWGGGSSLLLLASFKLKS